MTNDKIKKLYSKINRLYGMIRDIGERANQHQLDKDLAYRERNQLVATLSKLYPSCLGRHDENDVNWGKDWMNIVYIQLPTGQVSWHIKDTEMEFFAHLEQDLKIKWDGHTTEQKYKRLNNLPELIQ